MDTLRSLGFLSKGLEWTNICYVSFFRFSPSILFFASLRSDLVIEWPSGECFTICSSFFVRKSIVFLFNVVFFTLFSHESDIHVSSREKGRGWKHIFFDIYNQINGKKCRCFWTTAMAKMKVHIFFSKKKTLVTNVVLTSSILSQCKVI